MLATLGALVASTPLVAQRVAGHGDDAIQLPKGSWRVRIGGRWDIANEDFGVNGRRPLGQRYARDSLGVELIPTLASAEALARRLSGLSALSLSVGQLDARLSERSVRVPMSIELGLTRRVSLGIVVPYVETRSLPDLLLNPTAETGAFGPNPSRVAARSAAATSNTRLLTGALQTARTALMQRLTDCTADVSSNPACATVIAERGAVDAIIAGSASLRDDVRALYGEQPGTGAAVVPVSGSTADRLIGVRLRGLGKDLSRYGIDSPLATITPSAAITRYGTAGLQSLLRDTAFAIRNDSLRTVRRYGIGDVDLTASFLVLDQVTRANHAPLARFEAPRRFAIRSLVEAGWRFGSAGADRPADPFDIAVGSGASALLVRSSTDVLWSSRSWATVTARLVLPQADQLTTRVPLDINDLFPPEATTVRAQRTVGRVIDVEVAPRHAISQALGVSAIWRWRSQGSTQWQAVDAPTLTRSFDALERTSAASEQRISLGVTYSTLAPFARRRSKHAVELLYEHSEPLSGTSQLAAVAWDRFELRWYPGYARR
jgi:hypothetical protein